jgi:inhibitor of cysteine peptidase
MKPQKTLPIIGIALLLVLLAGCDKVVNVDFSMNGSSVTLEKGQQMVLKLESNPTTGFDWEIVGLGPAILKQVGEVEYKSDSMLIGSGGVDTWTFEAVGSGQMNLQLIYHRSWEKDIPPIETFDLDVTVK